MYQCGNRNDYQDIKSTLNKKIKAGDLSSFKKLR
jgi:hypothetical protein